MTSTSRRATVVDDLGPAGPELAGLAGAWKRFGSGPTAVEALRGVDLVVRAGELLAVLGPNGAGKTTAISMLTGLGTPTEGSARLFGRDPRDLAARQRIGVMLQSAGVPDTLRVRELLAAFRGYYPSPRPLGWVVDAAGLDGLQNRMFGTLSGGQQRRVLFAIALCGDPELLFVDEPTTGLDAEARRTLWATLRHLADTDRGVVLTTHYLEEADVLADRVVVLHQGRVVAQGTPTEIKALVPGRRLTAESAVPADQARQWPGVHHAAREGTRLELLVSEPEPVLRVLLQRDPSVTGLTVTEPSLEEAFLTLTNRMENVA